MLCGYGSTVVLNIVPFLDLTQKRKNSKSRFSQAEARPEMVRLFGNVSR
jgi:hypothetical protein